MSTNHNWEYQPTEARVLLGRRLAVGDRCSRCGCYRARTYDLSETEKSSILMMGVEAHAQAYNPLLLSFIATAEVSYKPSKWNPFSVTKTEPACKP